MINFSKKIPVVFISDRNYFMPMMVAIESLLYHKNPSTYYDIFCLISKGTQISLEHYINKLEKRYTNFSLQLVNMGGFLSNAPVTIEHVSYTTYYRFKIADILPQYKKAIYLDVDIIIKQDLTELFSIPLYNNFIGGVKHALLSNHTSIKGFKINQGEYINVGVLLMNLAQIRLEKKADEWILLINKGFPILDQDILNVSCIGRISFLPLSFNLMTKLFTSSKRNYVEQFYKDEFHMALQKPVIIHYADYIKPWNCYDLPYQDDWDKFFSLSDFSHIKLYRTSYWVHTTRYQLKRCFYRCRNIIKSIPVIGKLMTKITRFLLKCLKLVS